MEGNIIALIQSYMPEVQIEYVPHIEGSYKIRLPRPVNKMERYEALRNALKEFGAKPNCISCHQGNTKFRYFDNNSSMVLQARYKCLNCSVHFTLGGKQYSKDQSAIAEGQTNIMDQTRRSKRFMEVDESKIKIDETKRMRQCPLTATNDNINIRGNVPIHPMHAHQLGADQYLGVGVFQQQQQEQLASCSQNKKNELRPQLLAKQSKAVTTVATGKTSRFNDLYPVGTKLNDPRFNDYSSDKNAQWVKSQGFLEAITLPYMQSSDADTDHQKKKQ